MDGGDFIVTRSEIRKFISFYLMWQRVHLFILSLCDVASYGIEYKINLKLVIIFFDYIIATQNGREIVSYPNILAKKGGTAPLILY